MFALCSSFIELFPVPGGELYSGTVADFQGTIPLIFREPLKTDHNDLKQLNGELPLSRLLMGLLFFENIIIIALHTIFDVCV